MCTGEVLVPPSGEPCPTKCFGSATTLWSPLRLSPCAPRTYANPIRPVRYASSPKSSSTRPHRGSRARSSTGARIISTPLARASAAIASADLRAISGLHVAASPMGAGKTVPVSYPCSASSIKIAGIPSRLCEITHAWIWFACSAVGYKSWIPPTPRSPKSACALSGRKTAPCAACVSSVCLSTSAFAPE